MIEIRHLSKSYTTNNEKIEVLKDVNIELPNKGMIAIVGKSGVGKTTLLNLIGGIDCFEEGEIIVNNKNLKELKEKELSEYRRKEIGIVYQKYQLLEEINVIDNIKTYLEISRIKRREEEIEEILKELGIEGLKKRKVNELSGGQQQRVALAEVILKKPKILLCDEVTGALDKESGENVFNKLKEISKERLVIIISHQEEIKEYADIIIEIKEGKIEVQGTIESEQNKTTISNKEKETKTKIGSYLRILKGWTTVKVKRLIFLGFGLIITFLLLLFTISVSFLDEKKIELNSAYAENSKYIKIESKSYFPEPSNWRDAYVLTAIDVKYIHDNYGLETIPVYNSPYFSHFCNIPDEFHSEALKYIQGGDLGEFVEINDELMNRLELNLICGHMPQANNEILITDYWFNIYKKFGYKYDNEIKNISNYNDIINLIYNAGSNTFQPKFKIVGIIDTSKASDFKHLFFTYQGFNIAAIEKIDEDFSLGYRDNTFSIKLNNDSDDETYLDKICTIKNFSECTHKEISIENVKTENDLSNEKIVYIDDKNKENGIIVILKYDFFSSYIKEVVSDSWDSIKDEFEKETKESNLDDYVYYIKQNEINKFQPEYSYANLFKEAIETKLKKSDTSTFLSFYNFETPVNLVGFYLEKSNKINDDINSNIYTAYACSEIVDIYKNVRYNSQIYDRIYVALSYDLEKDYHFYKDFSHKNKIYDNKTIDEYFIQKDLIEYTSYNFLEAYIIEPNLFRVKSSINTWKLICTIISIFTSIISLILLIDIYQTVFSKRKSLYYLRRTGMNKKSLILFLLFAGLLIITIPFLVSFIIIEILIASLELYFKNAYQLTTSWFNLTFLKCLILYAISLVISSILIIYFSRHALKKYISQKL